MLPMFEHAAVGVMLITTAAVGLARAAVYFRRHDDGGERFLATSFTAVALVALFVGGAFYLGHAALAATGAWQPLTIAAAATYAIVVPVLIWNWIGPRTDATGTTVTA